MDNFTYRNLLAELNNMTEEELELSVTYYSRETDEFTPIFSLAYSPEAEDRLDPLHPYLWSL